jgi:hypothetical protein
MIIFKLSPSAVKKIKIQNDDKELNYRYCTYSSLVPVGYCTCLPYIVNLGKSKCTLRYRNHDLKIKKIRKNFDPR